MRTSRRAALTLTVAAAAVVSGCGGHSGERARVEAAIRSSQLTYFAYRHPLYWGRPVHFRVASVRIAGDYAGALVAVSDARGRAARPELVLLGRTNWRVVEATEKLGSGTLGCRLAPHGVIRSLFGNCAPGEIAAEVTPVAEVDGQTVRRQPTPDERGAIVAATRAVHFKPGQDRCVHYLVRMSKIDDRFASVDYRFEKPYTGCLLGNGMTLMERRAGHWRVRGDASEPFSCNLAPPGVIRSLFGGCWIQGEPKLRTP